MICKPAMRASLNSPALTQTLFTSFHVLTLLALRAASTASLYCSKLTKQRASFALLLIDANRSLAAENICSSKHRSPTSSMRATFGALINSSSSPSLSAMAYA